MDRLRELATDAGTFARSAGRIAARAYRKTDLVKPTLDRIVDTTALLFTANAALSTGLYHGRRTLEQTLGYDAFSDDIARGIIVAGTYALANRALWPLVKRVAKRRTTPSWPNHLKTWMIAGAVYLLWNNAGIKEDFQQVRQSLSTASDAHDVANALLDPGNLRLFDRYLSGEKAYEVGTSIAQFLSEWGYLLPSEQSSPIEREVARVHLPPLPSFPYTDNLSSAARSIQRQGIHMTPEQLAYISRVVYFEGLDGKLKTPEERLLGMEAITHVMLNRWRYDQKNPERPFSSKENHQLFDVVFKSGKKTRKNVTYTLWQFTAIRDHPEYFRERKGEKGWDLYDNNRINVAVGRMDRPKADLAYRAVMNVLSGKSKDPTSGALFYQNIKASDKFNKDWPRRGLEVTVEIGSHTFYRPTTRHALMRVAS